MCSPLFIAKLSAKTVHTLGSPAVFETAAYVLGSLLEGCEAAQGETVPARGWGLRAWSLNGSPSRPWGGPVSYTHLTLPTILLV